MFSQRMSRDGLGTVPLDGFPIMEVPLTLDAQVESGELMEDAFGEFPTQRIVMMLGRSVLEQTASWLTRGAIGMVPKNL